MNPAARARPTATVEAWRRRRSWRCSALIVIAGSLQVGIGWGAEGPRAGFFPFYVGTGDRRCPASSISSRRHARAMTASCSPNGRQLRQVVCGRDPDDDLCRSSFPTSASMSPRALLIAVFMMWLGRYSWPIVARGRDRRAGRAPILMFEKWFLVPLPKGPIEELLGLLSGSEPARTIEITGRRRIDAWKISSICFTASPSCCSRSTSC